MNDNQGLQTSRKSTFMLFVPADFSDFSCFFQKLHAHSDPVSAHIWEQFSPSARDNINKEQDDTKIQPALIAELNRILQSGHIYSKRVFSSDKLSKETKHLLSMNPYGPSLVELNRRIIEDSYQLEIVRLPHNSSMIGYQSIVELTLKVIPILLAIVYATGFLIVSAFLNRFGVDEASMEFLRTTYIQTGLLYLAFPVFILVPLFIFIRLRCTPHATTKMPTIAITGMLNLLFIFYYFATYAQPGSFYDKRLY